MVTQLRLIDPAVSAEIGTPERGIIDTTAETVASEQVDFTVLNQQTDLSTLSGGRLDAYLSIFQFGRQQATPSYGTVTFSRNLSASAQIIIPRGTQIQANLDNSVFPSLVFVTVDAAVLEVGSTSVNVLAQCTVAGTVGNIDASKVVGFAGLQSVAGISGVSNAQAFTKGTDMETDTAYVVRFQNSFLRHISGTTDMFLALAVAANSVTKASVIGPQSRYQEYIQVPATDDVAQVTAYDASGARATVVLTSDNVLVLDADTVTVNNRVYRFKNTLALANDVKIVPADVDGTLTNLAKAINQTGLVGTDYFAGTAAPTDVTSSAVGVPGAHQLTFFSKSYSTAGNSYLSTTTSAHLSYGSGTFLGGVNATYQHKRTTAKSTIPYSKYTYLSNYYLTDSTLDPATATFFRPQVDFVFNAPPVDATVAPSQTTTTPITSPDITFLQTAAHGGSTLLTDNALTLFEHAYMSVHSRNDSGFGIFNCVDVFINGEQQLQVSSQEVVPDSTHVLQNTNALLWTFQHPAATTVINWVRPLDSTNAAVGSLVQPLYWQPVIAVPDLVTIGASTYYRANFWNSSDSTYYNQFDGSVYSLKAHYVAVEEVNALYGTIRCRNSIEWFLAGNNYLNGQLDSDVGSAYNGVKIDTQTGTQFTCEDYIFDQNVGDLQAIMEKNKQTTQDVLVHRAKRRYFQPIVTIMYTLGATQAVVNVAIAASLAAFFENQYYGAAIQLSDILQVIHNTAGVDNVRWTNESGNKVQEVARNGNALGTPTYFTVDFFIQDNELAAAPDSQQVTITARAQNTFAS